MSEDAAKTPPDVPPSPPDIDVGKAADDVKAWIEKDKYNQIDYNYKDIEMYPPPADPDLPELTRFAAQWTAVFDYADKVTAMDGAGFPAEPWNSGLGANGG